MTLHTPSPSYEEAVRARYRAARNRLWNTVKREEPEAQPDTPQVRIVVCERPAWRIEDIHFNAHELEYRRHLFDIRTHTEPRAYLRKRCEELGFAYEDIIGHSRIRVLLEPRHLIMWEIKQKFPRVSYPMLGRMFGGRDHTTAMSAVQRIANIKAMEAA